MSSLSLHVCAHELMVIHAMSAGADMFGGQRTASGDILRNTVETGSLTGQGVISLARLQGSCREPPGCTFRPLGLQAGIPCLALPHSFQEQSSGPRA